MAEGKRAKTGFESTACSAAVNLHQTEDPGRVLAKYKKPFNDGDMVKEAFLEAADSLFDDFKNKTEIVKAIKEVQLSRRC
ncbi:unnamed protein product [Leuciscus chuanchicus]